MRLILIIVLLLTAAPAAADRDALGLYAAAIGRYAPDLSVIKKTNEKFASIEWCMKTAVPAIEQDEQNYTHLAGSYDTPTGLIEKCERDRAGAECAEKLEELTKDYVTVKKESSTARLFTRYCFWPRCKKKLAEAKAWYKVAADTATATKTYADFMMLYCGGSWEREDDRRKPCREMAKDVDSMRQQATQFLDDPRVASRVSATLTDRKNRFTQDCLRQFGCQEFIDKMRNRPPPADTDKTAYETMFDLLGTYCPNQEKFHPWWKE